jgi:uncharacterized protein (TIGR00251 family)
LSFQHPSIVDTSNGVVLIIHAQPNAKRTEFAGSHGDALKFRVASPPVDGAANESLCCFLAERLSVAPSRVVVKAGVGSRRKRVLITGITSQQVAEVFRLQPQ